MAELNLAQLRLERDPSVDWWFLLTRVSLPLTAGSNDLPLPADYLRLAEQSVPVLYQKDGAAVGKLVRAYQEDAVFYDTKTPTYYVLEGNTFKVYPTPEQDFDLNIQYVKKESELSESTPTNLWVEFAYTLLMNKAGIALAQGIQHKDALANFSADYIAAYREVFNESVARSDLTFSQARE